MRLLILISILFIFLIIFVFGFCVVNFSVKFFSNINTNMFGYNSVVKFYEYMIYMVFVWLLFAFIISFIVLWLESEL